MGKRAKAVKAATPAWRRQLAALLGRARYQNAKQAFAVARNLQGLPFDIATSIQVTGLPGPLQLPINEQQLSGLLSLGEPAPFGLGTETVLDPAVRKATQIEAARVQTDDIWQQQMQQLTARVAKGLGVDEHVHVEAHPYKLLIYTEGGHFKAHRDTEKEPGMFGTLVVQLPVIGGHKGGEFVFRHNGKVINWATEVNSSSQFQYAAFYADVEHELHPIRSGTRVVLVYSLVRTGTSLTPKLLDVSPLIQEMRAAVTSWEQGIVSDGPQVQQQLYVPLEHRYTEQSLSFQALKGRDAKMLSCLTHPDVGLEVHVALMVKTKQYRDDRDPDECRPNRVSYTAHPCISASGTLPYGDISSKWLKPEASWLDSQVLHPQEWIGNQVQETAGQDKDQGEESDEPSMDQKPYKKPEVADDDSYEEPERDYDEDDEDEAMYGSQSEDSDRAAGRKEDELRDVNYTGNECSTVEKIYRQAMVVIWPKSQTSTMVGTKDLEKALYLLNMRARGGSETEMKSALDKVISIYQEAVDADNSQRKQHPERYNDYSEWRGPFHASTLAYALLVCSKLQVAVAVPAMLTIINNLQVVGHNDLIRYKSDPYELEDNWHWHQGEDRYPDPMRSALVGSLIAVGEPDVIVSALADRIKSMAIKGTIACARLAVAAAEKSSNLGAAIADAVLFQTLFASDAAQVLASLPDTHVCSLAVMLCEIPSHRKHLDAYAAAVASLPAGKATRYGNETDKLVLKLLLKSAQFQVAAFHTPTAVIAVAEAYKQWWLQKLKPVPDFTWAMPDAKLPDFPEVEAFFHNQQMSATFTDCFKDAASARKLLHDHLRCWVPQGASSCSKDVYLYSTISAKVTASGLDGVPVITITKTRQYHDSIVTSTRSDNYAILARTKPADALLNVCSNVVAGAGVIQG